MTTEAGPTPLPDDELAAARRRMRAAYEAAAWVRPQADPADVRVVLGSIEETIERLAQPLDSPMDRLYLLGFIGPSLLTKPGRSTNVVKRIRDLRDVAYQHGYFLTDVWISRPAINALEWETPVKGRLRLHPCAGWTHGEYVHGVDFEDLIRIAEEAYDPFEASVKRQRVRSRPRRSR